MRITGLGHAGIGVSDIQASKAFYSGVLGMRALPSPEARKLSFQVNDSERLTVCEVGRAAHSGDFNHVAFIVGNTPRMLDLAAEHLDAHQVTYERVAHDEHESLYCRDPDGHLVELYYWPSW